MYAGGRGGQEMLYTFFNVFFVHCDFEKGSRNQHFQSANLVGRQGVTKKDYSVYALDGKIRDVLIFMAKFVVYEN